MKGKSNNFRGVYIGLGIAIAGMILQGFVQVAKYHQWVIDHAYDKGRAMERLCGKDIEILACENTDKIPATISAPHSIERIPMLEEYDRTILIDVRNRGHDIRVERFIRVKPACSPRCLKIVYDGFTDGRKTQPAMKAEDIMRWLGNALEDGT